MPKIIPHLLRDAKKRSKDWLEHSPVCTKIVDLDLKLQYMSEAGVKGLGLSDITEYYGKPYPLDFYPLSFRDQMTETIQSARDSKKTMTQEASVISIKGDEIWFHSTIMPIYDKDNQLEYFMIVSIDTTERKSAEMKLLKMNEKLETLVKRRTEKLEQANKLLKLSSEIDFLTNVSNRRFYDRRLSENISTAKRNETYLALLMIDIDNFKEYNDKYGHDVGDNVLRNIAKSIEGSLHRDTDLVARFGGEEFVVLLPDTDNKIALSIAEKIQQNIKKLSYKHKLSSMETLTVSIGIEAMKGNKLNAEDLLKHSDLALYSAKDNGKNCIKIYSDIMHNIRPVNT